MKKYIIYIYKILQLILVACVTLLILSIGFQSHDNQEMSGLFSPILVAIAWTWFISFPLLLIVFISFFYSIPPKTKYKKLLLSLHILNILLCIGFYVFLPSPEPCDTAIMENHYMKHKDDMLELIRYTRSVMDDSCSIELNYRNGKIVELYASRKNKRHRIEDINSQEEIDSTMAICGISPMEHDNIYRKMQKAGVIGIEINNKEHTVIYETIRSILLYKWYGVNRYQYALYDTKMTAEEKEQNLALHQFIFYNDSIVFESYGGYPGGRGFPDKDDWDNKKVKEK